jgi:hypothetical protein
MKARAAVAGALLLYLAITTMFSSINNIRGSSVVDRITFDAPSPYVYVYDIPDDLLLSEGHSCKYCDWHPGYSVERVVLNAIKSSAWATTDPSKARWFLVPMYYSCVMNCKNPPYDEKSAVAYVEKIFEFIENGFEGGGYWARNSGEDHIFVWGQDKGAYRIAEHNPVLFNKLRQGLFMQTVGTWMPGRPEAVDLTWDIVLPSVAFSGKALPTLKSKKRMLAFWQGSVKPTRLYPVRKRLANRFLGHPDISVLPFKSDSFLDDLKSSTFCLYLPGHLPQRWSASMGQMLEAGCLILWVNDFSLRPFEELLDWDSFSVRIPEGTMLAKGPESGESMLSQLSDDQLSNLMANWRVNRPHLLFNVPSQHGDATDMIIKSLKLRENRDSFLSGTSSKRKRCLSGLKKKYSPDTDCGQLSHSELKACLPASMGV